MRIFGSERMDGMLQKLGLKEDEAIIHPWINKALEKAQKKVEARNFDIRKNLLKYDDVMNDQRKVIFEQRIELMDGEDVAETIAEMRQDVIEEIVAKHIPENAYAEQWDVAGLHEAESPNCSTSTCRSRTGPRKKASPRRHPRAHQRRPPTTRPRRAGRALRPRRDALCREARCCCRRSTICGASTSSTSTICAQVVGFRGYAQRDPLNEYKSEAFELFQAMLGNLRQAVTAQLMRVELVRQAAEAPPPGRRHVRHHIDGRPARTISAARPPLLVRQEPDAVVARGSRPEDPATWGKVGRNEACPCGSGKKYKHCHGQLV